MRFVRSARPRGRDGGIGYTVPYYSETDQPRLRLPRVAFPGVRAAHQGGGVAMPQRPTNAGIELYRSIGVNPVINGIGSVTFLVSPSTPRVALRRLSSSPWPPQGGSTPDPRVEAAMDAANASYVPMDELQKVSVLCRALMSAPI